MSYDDDDYGREQFYDQVREELTPEIVGEFTFDRLRSFYLQNLEVAKNPYNALVEAKLLLKGSHHTAAFIHAAIAAEVAIKGVFVKPIVMGLVHNELVAPLITDMVMRRASGQFTQIKDILFKILDEIAGINLVAYLRTGAKENLWAEIGKIVDQRNGILHRAESATSADAEFAIAVASEIFEKLFPALATKLGFHLHGGFELCEKQKCSPEYLAMCQKMGIPP